MDRFFRILELNKIFNARRTPVSRRDLEELLESNRSTIKRTIEEMRLFLDAPIKYDRRQNGYYYDIKEGEHPFEIPGLWFNSNELFALMVTHRLLSKVQPGLLDASISPFRRRIEALLKGKEAGRGEIAHRVRILQAAVRPTRVDDFRKVTTALVNRCQLRLFYHSRSGDETTDRIVSPQRLVYYRDNWYLDAYCHLRNELRTFSLDRLKPIRMNERPAKEIDDQNLDDHFTKTFGIFAGVVQDIATLHFTSQASKWVADEYWHPEQEGNILKDGGYELKIPYGNSTELVREILKYGAEVEVVEPKSLRDTVASTLQAAIRKYQK